MINIFLHNKYSTAQMQFHTRACVLACPHTCANMCPVTSDGTLTSLTYCTHVLHEGLHTRVCYSSGYTGTYTYATRVSPMCSRQSLRRIIWNDLATVNVKMWNPVLLLRRKALAFILYSSDIISGYSEWASVVLKILTSREMCKFSLLCFQKERWHLWMG